MGALASLTMAVTWRRSVPRVCSGSAHSSAGRSLVLRPRLLEICSSARACFHDKQSHSSAQVHTCYRFQIDRRRLAVMQVELLAVMQVEMLCVLVNDCGLLWTYPVESCACRLEVPHLAHKGHTPVPKVAAAWAHPLQPAVPHAHVGLLQA
jgi:hypothetical protein